MKFNIIIFVGTVLSIASPTVPQDKFNIVDSINKFAIDLLGTTNSEGGDSLNIALSPHTVWTLMTITAEGAYDSTADQLDRVLRQPQNKNVVRSSHQTLSQILQAKSDGAEFETSNGMFTNEKFTVKEKFLGIAKQYYDTNVTPVNFKDNAWQAAETINKYVAKATRNRVMNLVTASDVTNAQLFLVSTMYFKGQWKTPFNKSATQRDTFYDEKKNKIGEVNMMYQVGPYPYTRIDKLKADALELPYGFDDSYSMLVLLPRGAQNVANLLNLLTRESITEILSMLEKAHQTFEDEDIHVYFPKFKIISDFNLDGVLDKMGIKDVFDPQKANLLGMFNHYLFLSRVIQKAEIEVDEEGTVATAAAGSEFVNRSPPPKFRANRPFLYFIINKQSGSIVFAGKLSNPNTL